MTKYDLKENILKHRMNFLINYYVQTKNSTFENNNILRDYYIRNYRDDYLLKPSLNIVDRDNCYNASYDTNNEEKRDDDIEEHYKYMFTVEPPKPEIDYDELDKKYYDELSSIENQQTYDDDDYYEDEYYEDEYCEIDNNYDDDEDL